VDTDSKQLVPQPILVLRVEPALPLALLPVLVSSPLLDASQPITVLLLAQLAQTLVPLPVHLVQLLILHALQDTICQLQALAQLTQAIRLLQLDRPQPKLFVLQDTTQLLQPLLQQLPHALQPQQSLVHPPACHSAPVSQPLQQDQLTPTLASPQQRLRSTASPVLQDINLLEMEQLVSHAEQDALLASSSLAAPQPPQLLGAQLQQLDIMPTPTPMEWRLHAQLVKLHASSMLV